MNGLILKECYRSLLAMVLLALIHPFVLDQPDAQRPLAELVAAHREQLNKLQPIHYKVVNYKGNKEYKTFSYEIWLSSSKSACVDKNYIELKDGKEKRLDENKCQVSTTILDEKNAKRIQGFDLNHIPSQPLELGRNAWEFSKINGTLTARNPKSTYFISLFDVIPMMSFERLSKVAELVVEKSDVPNLACITVKSAPAKYLVGDKIYLDPSKNFLMAKHVSSVGGVATVVDWHEMETGVWCPKKITYHDKDGKLGGISEIEFAKKMTPEDMKLLETSFPEGSRVEEPEKKLVHLWGKGSPQATFESMEEFVKFIHAKARDYQAKNFVNPSPPNRPTSPNGFSIGTWLWIGLAGLALAAFLFWLGFKPRKA